MIKKIFKIIKRMLLFIVGLIVVLTIGTAIFMNTSPQFGGSPSEESLVKINSSPNYKDNAFKNLEHTVQNTGIKWSSIPEFFTSGNGKVPTKALPQKDLSSEDFQQEIKEPRLTWFGHSAMLLELEDTNIFIDPMLGNVPSPVSWMGSGRFNRELPIKIEDLPEIDIVLISHDHYDHLDYESITKLKSKVKQFYVPLGIKAHLTAWGVEEKRVKEFDWWENISFNNIEFTATPARHFSGRGFKGNKTLWCSWVIKSEISNIFFSGDSGYGSHFKEIGERFGPFDFAMMECGQYNEQWSQIHMMPEETVQATIDVEANKMMPIHWGAFKLALHTWDDPVKRASKKAIEHNITMVTPKIGEAMMLNEENNTTKWWVKVE
ncbi:MBL fold metallo-hydrolase [Winogradskyella sp.]|uniref:MBL fold metallo-hydrolase n=1 Tax=Winogradskyella sp. TaxID=1883156 RepID=UPI0025DE530E|nr:MBL fold metallo-hydrolase [Winogradskyella sp.]